MTIETRKEQKELPRKTKKVSAWETIYKKREREKEKGNTDWMQWATQIAYTPGVNQIAQHGKRQNQIVNRRICKRKIAQRIRMERRKDVIR